MSKNQGVKKAGFTIKQGQEKEAGVRALIQ